MGSIFRCYWKRGTFPYFTVFHIAVIVTFHYADGKRWAPNTGDSIPTVHHSKFLK